MSQDIVRIRMAGLTSALFKQGHTKIPEDLALLSPSGSAPQSPQPLQGAEHRWGGDTPSLGSGTAELPAQNSLGDTSHLSCECWLEKRSHKRATVRGQRSRESCWSHIPWDPSRESLLLSKRSSCCPSFRWSPRRTSRDELWWQNCSVVTELLCRLALRSPCWWSLKLSNAKKIVTEIFPFFKAVMFLSFTVTGQSSDSCCQREEGKSIHPGKSICDTALLPSSLWACSGDLLQEFLGNFTGTDTGQWTNTNWLTGPGSLRNVC